MVNFTLHALVAETGPDVGAAVDIGNRRELTAVVRVAAGSGTVNPFRVWIEGTVDGTNFFEIPCKRILKDGIAAPGAAGTDERDIVSEVAVLTSGVFFALLELNVSKIRAAWNIAGTTPSETFEVRVRG